MLNRIFMKIKAAALLFSFGACLAYGQVETTGGLPLVPVTATLQNAATSNGNGSTLTTIGWFTALFTVNCSVSCTGGTTITFQGSDGTNFVPLLAQQVGGTTLASTVVNQGTTVTLWQVNVAGLTNIRAPISNYSAGTITVTATVVGSPLYAPFSQVSVSSDPCGQSATGPSAWIPYPVSISSNTQVVAGSSGKNVYICKAAFPPQSIATNIGFVEGTGSVCASSTTGMMGGSTAALGAVVVINGGYIVPSDGHAWAKTATAGDSFCLFVSAQTSGVIWYVQQ